MKARGFIALFFLLCLIPSVGMLVLGPAQPAANETLPPPPQLRDETGGWNRRILNDASDYLEQRFALRQEMVTANHALGAILFQTSLEEAVLLGEDGWLFYGETLEDYEGVYGMTERELWSAAHALALMQEYCQSRQVAFLFTVAPNKNSLYGEFMPERYPSGAGKRNIDRLVPRLKAEGVAYLDLFAPLAEEETILYRNLDSHWTQEGAGLAGDEILSALGRTPLGFYGGETVEVREARGDLDEMLYPKGRRKDRDVVYTRPFTFAYDAQPRSMEDHMIRTLCPNAQGSLLMFRDSFGNALHLFMAEGFGRAAFCRLIPYDLGLLDGEEADTVVIELVERNLDWLNTRSAKFPAPVRQLEGEMVQDAAVHVEWTEEEDTSLIGYQKVSGTVLSPALEEETRLYLRVDDVIYEATPTGETSFQAYIPQSTFSQTVSLLVVQGERILERQAMS